MAPRPQPKKHPRSRADEQADLLGLQRDFAVVIRRARGKTSQVSLAAASGLDQGTISLYERGLRLPSLDNLARIEAALGLNRGAIVHAVYCDLPSVRDQLANYAPLDPVFRAAVLNVFDALLAAMEAGD
jgi:transcriptional regulator with XRE-family HTH domain